jgi:hypothetical protein
MARPEMAVLAIVWGELAFITCNTITGAALSRSGHW